MSTYPLTSLNPTVFFFCFPFSFFLFFLSSIIYSFIDLLIFLQFSDEEVRIELTVSPRGALVIPQTSHQLKSAITNILEALEDLHKYEDVEKEGG